MEDIKTKEEPKLEKIEVISPSIYELKMLEDEGYTLYAIKEDRYLFNRWVLQ